MPANDLRIATTPFANRQLIRASLDSGSLALATSRPAPHSPRFKADVVR